MSARRELHLAVALDGTGWHPAAWREPDARPTELLTAGYWVDVVRRAEAGLIDLVTIEDGLGLQSDEPLGPDQRVDRVRGRLDATLIAAFVAPLTTHIGLVPTGVATHTEPFHLSKLIASVDYASRGRAGIQVRVSARADEAAHFGRREIPQLTLADLRDPRNATAAETARALVTDLFEEATDYVEALRRLWDSWEDDAEIRDVATSRFIDRDKLHYIDFEGRFFSVRGPSITPRPPQGQPVVAALAHRAEPFRLVATSADVGFVTPHDVHEAAAIVAEIRGEQAAAGRAHETVHVFADLVVLLDDTVEGAVARQNRLDELAGAPYESDALIFAGTAAGLADLLVEWQGAGLNGFRLRPATIPHDLDQITTALVPELQARGVFRTAYDASTLRGLLGLPVAPNRYAAA